MGGGEGGEEAPVNPLDANIRWRVFTVRFGRRMKSERQAAGMSQHELGKRARMNQKFVGEIERGRSNPSLKSMLRLADALGCELTELLEDEKPLTSLLLRPEDAGRAREAVTVLASVLKPAKQPRRKSTRWTNRSR